jgi:hypothetical protein
MYVERRQDPRRLRRETSRRSRGRGVDGDAKVAAERRAVTMFVIAVGFA